MLLLCFNRREVLREIFEIIVVLTVGQRPNLSHLCELLVGTEGLLVGTEGLLETIL